MPKRQPGSPAGAFKGKKGKTHALYALKRKQQEVYGYA